MIRLIDGFVFWFLTLSALFLALMILTGGKIIISCLAAMLIAIGLHALWKRFSEPLHRRLRSTRREYVQSLIGEWAVLPENALLNVLSPFLPIHETNAQVVVLPYAPASRALNADALIACRRAHPQGKLTVVALCPAEKGAQSWAERLSICLIDGRRLTHLLMAAYPVVPESFHVQKKRRISFPTYSAFVDGICPKRSGLYALLALALYMARGGWTALLAFMLLGVMTALGIRGNKSL